MKFKNFDTKKLLFAKIAWMNEYKGNHDKDEPRGGGKYIEDTGRGGEEKNFKRHKEQYYGYVPPNNRKYMTLNIQEHFDARKEEHKISGITVIWIAPHLDGEGAVVVGWYRNATVFSQLKGKSGGYYQTQASVKDCHLLKPEERNLRTPKNFKRPRMYGDACTLKSEKEFLSKLNKLLNKPHTAQKQSKKPNSQSRSVDIENRRAVEQSAIDCVWTHYQNEGYDVKSVEKDNIGYDLEVSNGFSKFCVEVKGLSRNEVHCELTPNEYKYAKCNQDNYFLAVVTNARDKKPRLRIFKPITKKTSKKLEWCCFFGNDIKIRTKEKTGAVVSQKS